MRLVKPLIMVIVASVAFASVSHGQTCVTAARVGPPEPGRTFAEPLRPVGEPNVEETRELAAAIRTYRAAVDIEAVQPVVEFLQQHPDSAWKPSLCANLAVLYRHTGYLDHALTMAEEAWRLTATSTDPEARKIADDALATRIEVTSALGRTAELAALLDAVRDRPLSGHAAEMVSGARSSLWQMRHDPGSSFRCGPLAIERVAAVLHPGALADPRVQQYRSTSQGTSLAEMARLAQTTGLDLQAVKRQPGSPIPVPAVVHWKADHFAALVAQQGDRYLVKDMTFGDDRWLSRAAVEEESSGYLLAQTPKALSDGWRRVTAAEAAAVRGRGASANPNPGATTPGDPKKPALCGGNGIGMPVYNFHTAVVSLNVTDAPVGYQPPRGPAMRFGITYNSREDFQPSTFTFTNLGSRWSFDWLSYVEDDDPNGNGNTIRVAELGGGSYILPQTSTTSGYQYGPNVRGTHETVTRIYQTNTNTTIGFARQFPDGSQEIYQLSDNAAMMRKYFLTAVTDTLGNTITLNYDAATTRLLSITDALGQTTTLTYGLAGDIYKVTAVTDPFGRQALFQYSGGELQSVTDAEGMTSSFAYGRPTVPAPAAPYCVNFGYDLVYPVPADFMNAMTTPYGTTTFVMGEEPPCVDSDLGNIRWLVATNPLGNQERIEFTHEAQNVPETTTEPIPAGFGNENLAYRNTYYWNQTAMEQYSDGDPNRYLNATYTFHWLRDFSEGGTAASSIPGFVQPLGQRRTWMGYPNMPGDSDQGSLSEPTVTATVLDSGQTRAYTYAYNSSGRPYNYTDPTGRTYSYEYAANGIDMIRALATQLDGGGPGITWAGEQLATLTYNSQHEPLTYTDYANQRSTFTYNGFGEMTSVQRPDGVTTNFTYDGHGFLTRKAIAGTSYQETFTYDSADRLLTWTSTDGYTLTLSYDALDRLTRITYPDGTMDQVIYDKLDVVAYQDRMGRVTTYAYDAADRLASVTDPAGRTTTYSWCGCGALSQVADPRGVLTTWMLDGLNRVIGKQVNGATVALFTYDDAGRLIQRTDGLGQITNYSYTVDDRLAGVGYQNSVHTTPGVQYFYDQYYPRLAMMTDAFGSTTYTYNPAGSVGAGQVASITAPAPEHTIIFQYDVDGRRIGKTVDGLAQTQTYDSQDRLSSWENSLGTFTATYAGSSNRMATLSYPNGQGAVFSYLGGTQDFRLSQVVWGSTGNGPNLSQFGYSYDAAHQQVVGLSWFDINSPTGRFFNFTYDPAQQLTARQQTTNPAQSPVTTQHSYTFGYDASGNRTSETFDTALSTAAYDGANQLIRLDTGLSLQAQAAMQQLRAHSSAVPPPSPAGAAQAASDSVREGSHEN